MSEGQTVIGYARVSTDRQASDGDSLDAQRARIEAWALAHGYELGAVFTDAISGGRADNRPGLQSALAAVCQCRGVLVVYALSRVARSTRDTLDIAEQLERAGADLVSLSERIDTSSAAGKMVFRMLAVLAEFERDQTSERTRAVLDHKKAKGERIGKIPFGYQLHDDGVRLVDDPDEQQFISVMHLLREDGASYRQIAAELERAGARPKSGGQWYASTVRQIVTAA